MSRKVLIVEDENEIRQVVRMVVEDLLGYEALVAASGEEGIERASQSLPDLVVLDLLLPGMDGFTVASRLRADPRHNVLKILALSGLARENSLDRALAAGCNDVLAKPFDLDDLLGKMHELIDTSAPPASEGPSRL